VIFACFWVFPTKNLEEITTYVLKLYPNPKRNEKKKKSLEEKIQIEKKNQQTLEPNFYSANSLLITTNIDSQNSDDVAAALHQWTRDSADIHYKKKKNKKKPTTTNRMIQTKKKTALNSYFDKHRHNFEIP